MSIRVKLIIVYIVMIIISASLLIFSSMTLIATHFAKATEIILQGMEVDEAFLEVVDMITDLKAAEKVDNTTLLDEGFISSFDKRLQAFHGDLYVLYDDKWINVPDEEYNEEYFRGLIQQSFNISENTGPEIDDYKSYKPDDISFTQNFTINGKKATYFFVLNISDLERMQDNLGMSLILFMLLILLIATLPLVYILSKDIIKPLKVLESGVRKISEGDLDFKLEAHTGNEIGKIIHAFDKMRSELKKSIEKQLQYEENRKELISSISHDLKTPITSIKGYVQGIMDGVADDEEKLNKYLTVIQNKSQDMDRLIDELFMFSKLDLDRLSFNLNTVDLKRYMDDCIEELVLEYKQQGIHIDFQYEVNESVLVQIDQQMIKRVIMNIVQNAVKFMNKTEKNLMIHVTEENKALKLCIIDNGTGISPEKLPYIFDKFYRGDEARNSLQGGSGLGLAIAKQIIEKHGGDIYAQSKLGKGTTICFTLRKHEVEMEHGE